MKKIVINHCITMILSLKEEQCYIILVYAQLRSSKLLLLMEKQDIICRRMKVCSLVTELTLPSSTWYVKVYDRLGLPLELVIMSAVVFLNCTTSIAGRDRYNLPD